MAKIRLVANLNTKCQCCERPIKHAYLVEDGEFNIRVGSGCVKQFINVNDSSVKYIQKELKEVEKMRVQKEAIEVALKNENEDELKKAVGKLVWQYEHNNIVDGAKSWIETLEHRIGKRLINLDARTGKLRIKN